MLTEKTKKSNTKTTTKKGYDLKEIKTKKTSQPEKKQKGALNLFFSLMGFVLVIGGLMGLFVPIMAHAKQGVIIVEPFECETELANYHELLRALKATSKDDFKYPIFEKELRLTVEALKVHNCKGLKDGK